MKTNGIEDPDSKSTYLYHLVFNKGAKNIPWMGKQ
jgi:hypothetical protein